MPARSSRLLRLARHINWHEPPETVAADTRKLLNETMARGSDVDIEEAWALFSREKFIDAYRHAAPGLFSRIGRGHAGPEALPYWGLGCCSWTGIRKRCRIRCGIRRSNGSGLHPFRTGIRPNPRQPMTSTGSRQFENSPGGLAAYPAWRAGRTSSQGKYLAPAIVREQGTSRYHQENSLTTSTKAMRRRKSTCAELTPV